MLIRSPTLARSATAFAKSLLQARSWNRKPGGGDANLHGGKSKTLYRFGRRFRSLNLYRLPRSQHVLRPRQFYFAHLDANVVRGVGWVDADFDSLPLPYVHTETLSLAAFRSMFCDRVCKKITVFSLSCAYCGTVC